MAAKNIVDTGIVDADIVLVCHCKEHDTVYHNRTGIPVGNDISYVDPNPKCKNSSNWETIKSNSKKYVWGINCPVAPLFNIYPNFYTNFVKNNLYFNNLLSILQGGLYSSY